MNAIHPSQDANSPESVSSNVSAKVVVYSWELFYFVGKYQYYPSYGARVLAEHLADIYRPGLGFGYATQVELAEQMNISAQQVRVLLKEIAATGYWNIKRGSYSKKEATQYAPTPSELSRARRWKASKFDKNVSFTDPKVQAKSTKRGTHEAQGFTTPEALSERKSNAPVIEELPQGELPEWAQAPQQAGDTETVRDTPETHGPAHSSRHTAPKPVTESQDSEYVWESAAPTATQPAVDEHMDPFAGPQSTEPTPDTAWGPEPDSDLDAFGNPLVVTYDTPSIHGTRTYL